MISRRAAVKSSISCTLHIRERPFNIGHWKKTNIIFTNIKKRFILFIDSDRRERVQSRLGDFRARRFTHPFFSFHAVHAGLYSPPYPLDTPPRSPYTPSIRLIRL